MPLTKTTDDRRSYHSPLRQQQAQATRDRILAGLAQTMADGVAEVSMPAVAEAAGVSVATVYRHFPTKRALFEALPGYFARLVGMDGPTIPRSSEEFEDGIRRLFSMYEQAGDVARAAMASQLGDEARKMQMPKRLHALDQSIAVMAPALGASARGRIVRLVLVLTSSNAQRMLAMAGQGPERSAEDVIWAMRTLIDAELAQQKETTST